MLAVIIQTISSFVTLQSVTSIEVLLFGSCLLLITFVQDISHDLWLLNADNMPTERNGGMQKRFIDNHADIKQLSAWKLHD